MDSYRRVISFIILISFHVGHTLRCACKEDLRTCTSIQNMHANFKTAQQICMENGGKLLSSSSKIIESLLFNTTGHFWIDIENDCLNNNSSSRNSQSDFITLNRRGEDVACSSQCMAVSSNRNLTEHSCEEQTDGFLCDGIQWENCWENRVSEVQSLNHQGCRLQPCEHQCKEVPGGYVCTCFSKYRPSKKNWQRCEYYCDSMTCPRPCSHCECPDGFIKDDAQCTDLDECRSNHNNCEQKCINTFGHYKCSCHEGFVLVNRSKCVPFIEPTPLTAALVTPSMALAIPAAYTGLTLFIILVVSALIGLVYYLRKSKYNAILRNCV